MTIDQRLENPQARSETTWDLDPTHSGVEFAVKHLMFAKLRGRFRGVRATLVLDEADPTRSRLEAELEAASIDTATEDRDTHLRSSDFLDVEAHPWITYQSRRIDPLGAGKARVVGDLTIRGVTKEVVLDVTRDGEGTDPWGNTRSGFTATGALDRREFGLTWNQVLEAGGLLVGDTVKIEIQAQLVQRA